MLWTIEKSTDEMFESLTLADRAKIIELCMTKNLCLALVANAMKISTQTVSKVLSLYIPAKHPNGFNYVAVFESKLNKQEL